MRKPCCRTLGEGVHFAVSGQMHLTVILCPAAWQVMDFPKNKTPENVGWVERSVTHRLP